MHTHALLDRLNEWRGQTPELMGMVRRLISWSLIWSALKALLFPWAILSVLDSRRVRLLPLGGMLLQLLVLALPRLLLYAGLVICAQGLMGSDPFVQWALLALLILLTMFQVSCDLALSKVMAAPTKSLLSPRWAFEALAAWFTAPGTMASAWILRVLQIAVAAGPLYEQVKRQPGPSAPQSVIYFIAAADLLWALRLWMLARAQDEGQRPKTPPANEAEATRDIDPGLEGS